MRILPGNVANLIAAGEVVRRPASVVKELMENAVDAGADNVAVTVTDAGRTLVQVADNGCGMAPDEAVLCFERHATSKLSSAEDLEHILTFGFRGEALPSMAAVSEVTLRTRTADHALGCEVEYAGSVQVSVSETACPKGCSVSVRNLFYNVPARRKFLKSDNVEFRHIVEEFTRVALTRPEISFSLTHNGREIFRTRASESVKFRIQDLFSRNLPNELVEVSARSSIASVTGYAGRPDLAKKTTGNQFFFVNGRFFRSPYLHRAVMKAYDKMIPQGTTPSYFLYLEMPPEGMDVNIHPTKTEIKFEDESLLFQFVFAAVKEVLARNAFGASIDFEEGEAPALPVFGRHYEAYRPMPASPEVAFNPDYNPFDPSPSAPSGDASYKDASYKDASYNDDSSGDVPYKGAPSGDVTYNDVPYKGTPSGDAPYNDDSYKGAPSGDAPYNDAPYKGAPYKAAPPEDASSEAAPYKGCGPTWNAVDRRQDYGRLFEEKLLPATSVLILHSRYLLSPVRSGILIVHIRRARERILYERFLAAVRKNGHVSQCSLFPIRVVLGVANRTVFEEHTELLKTLGFDFVPEGEDSITVNGVPEGWSCEEETVRQLMEEVLVALTEDHTALPGMMEAAIAARFAAIGAAGSPEMTSPIEAQRLIDTLFSCENSEYTIQGLKILSILGVDEIEKKF